MMVLRRSGRDPTRQLYSHGPPGEIAREVCRSSTSVRNACISTPTDRRSRNDHHSQDPLRSRASELLTSTKRFALGLIFVVASIFLPQSAFGANSYWVGSAGGDWSDGNNWASADPASCTGGGAGVPGAGDTAIFDADCDNNATMDANMDVLGVMH